MIFKFEFFETTRGTSHIEVLSKNFAIVEHRSITFFKEVVSSIRNIGDWRNKKTQKLLFSLESSISFSKTTGYTSSFRVLVDTFLLVKSCLAATQCIWFFSAEMWLTKLAEKLKLITCFSILNLCSPQNDCQDFFCQGRS